MAKVTKHLAVVFAAKEIVEELDTLALDGWSLISFSPVNANNAELGVNAKIFCLLSRTVNE